MKCLCGNLLKVGEPRDMCYCCYRRACGWPEWKIKSECPQAGPDDEDYERSLKYSKGLQDGKETD
jgi:hypothetical protein